MQSYAKKLWAKSPPTLGVVGSTPIGYTKKPFSLGGGFMYFLLIFRRECGIIKTYKIKERA